MVMSRAKQTAINKTPNQAAADRIETLGSILRELSLNRTNSTTGWLCAIDE
jgi:hypothetical protein